MSILSKLFSRDTLSSIIKHAKAGIVRAHKTRTKSKEKKSNSQCVKLTKEHCAVVQMVSYWCNIRINELKQIGATKDTIDEIIKRDAHFLTALSCAIAMQNEKKPEYDAWLFFDTDVKSTPYFELCKCTRGTKDVTSSLVIRADR